MIAWVDRFQPTWGTDFNDIWQAFNNWDFPQPIFKIKNFIFSPRAVYDGNDVDYFMDKLGARIKDHDHEIERMCNYHYQGFIDSIRELQQVSGDATKLKVLACRYSTHTSKTKTKQTKNINIKPKGTTKLD